MDYLVSFGCIISDWLFHFAEHTGERVLHICFIYKLLTCFILLVSSHEKGYFEANKELLYAHKILKD